jgi:hypothetical protein
VWGEAAVHMWGEAAVHMQLGVAFSQGQHDSAGPWGKSFKARPKLTDFKNPSSQELIAMMAVAVRLIHTAKIKSRAVLCCGMLCCGVPPESRCRQASGQGQPATHTHTACQQHTW